MGLPQYQDNQEQLPPKLLTEGARVDPEWLRKFLSNPALSATDTNRNGVRPYLKVRMPTFFLSDDEIRTLVSFFQAMSSQPQPYIQQKIEPITTAEKEMARDWFTSTAAPCLKCHATGDPGHEKTAIAPNFLFAKERLQPGWTERWITNPALIAPGTAMRPCSVAISSDCKTQLASLGCRSRPASCLTPEPSPSSSRRVETSYRREWTLACALHFPAVWRLRRLPGRSSG